MGSLVPCFRSICCGSRDRLRGSLLRVRIGWRLHLLIARLARLGNASIGRRHGLRHRLRPLQARPGDQFPGLQGILGGLRSRRLLLGYGYGSQTKQKGREQIRRPIHNCELLRLTKQL